MASVLDVSVLNSGSTVPSAFSVSAGSNRKLLLFTAFNGAGDTMDSVTFGGEAMSAVTDTGEANSRRIYAWEIGETGIAAASGNTFSPSYTGSPASGRMHHVVVSVEDADQSAITEFASDTDGNDPQEVTLSALTSSVCFAMAYNNQETTSWTWGNGWTERHDNQLLGGTSSFAQQASSSSETASANPAATASSNLLLAVRVANASTSSIVPGAYYYLNQ